MNKKNIEFNVYDLFAKQYHETPDVIVRAPGRLEILGNHTDYNRGVVLSTAINRCLYLAAKFNKSSEVIIFNTLFNKTNSFDLNSIEEMHPEDPMKFIKGTIRELFKRGFETNGFKGYIDSEIPLSAGMSSSAAIETAVIYALAKSKNPDERWITWAEIGQACENNYIGANTGLMDQFSCIMGKKNHFVYSDFDTNHVRNVKVSQNITLVVMNSMVKHDLTGDYNERRQSCENAAKKLGKTSIRGIESKEYLKEMKHLLSQKEYKRALHVVGENLRVKKGLMALADGDLRLFGELMLESHESSCVNFENSCPELDILIEEGKKLPGFFGARLSGGGFGGISVHLVENDAAESYRKKLTEVYKRKTGIEAQNMIVIPEDGAEVISKQHPHENI